MHRVGMPLQAGGCGAGVQHAGTVMGVTWQLRPLTGFTALHCAVPRCTALQDAMAAKLDALRLAWAMLQRTK